MKQLQQDFEAAAQVAMEQGKKLGCDAVKVVLSSSKDKRLVIENGEFTLANVLESKSIGVMVLKDQRKGSTSLNSTNHDAVRKAVSDAFDLAKFSIPDPALHIPTLDQIGKATKLDFLFDPKIQEQGLDELAPLMHEGLNILTRDARLALERYEMSLSENLQTLANTNGLMLSEATTSIDWDYLGMARDDAADEVSGMDYDSGFSFGLVNAKEKMLQNIEDFQKRILLNLNPKKCPAYKGLVVFSPRAVSEILLDTLFYHISGSQVMDGRSKWEKHIGKKIVSDKLTIVDDPHDADLEGATTYDGDGFATSVQSIVDKGTLMMHLHSCYTARRMNAKPNAMSGGPFGIKINGGSQALADLLRSRKEILYVDRFSGNTDPLTGDFSGVAKTSSLFVNGARAHAVAETMIAGNVFDLLTNVVALSKEVENLSGDMVAPHALLDNVSVS